MAENHCIVFTNTGMKLDADISRLACWEAVNCIWLSHKVINFCI